MNNGSVRGFTLIELSIVLVIMALLVGGTLAGAELIKSAELRTIISKVEEYKAATSQFEQLYESLPGDFTTATSFWASTANVVSSNKQIAAEPSDEPFRALQQLSLAETINGTFTGTWGSGFVIGDTGNVPAIGNSGASMYIKCCSGTDYARTISFNNHVSLFSVYSNIAYRGGVVSPIQARDIDIKLDDGIPDFGFVGASAGYNGSAYTATGCYTGSGSTSAYATTSAATRDSPNCQMQFAYDWN